MFTSSAKNLWLSRDRGELKYLLAGLLVRLTGSLFAILATYLLLPLLLKINSGSDFFLPDLDSILGYFAAFKNFQEYILILGIASLLIGEIIAYYLAQIISIKHNKYLNHQLKCQGLNLLCQANPSFFTDNTIEDILFKLNREVDRAALAMGKRQELILMVISFLSLSGGLILISLPLTLVATAILSLTIVSDKIIINYLQKNNNILVKQNQLYHRQLVELPLAFAQIKQATIETQKYQNIAQLIKAKQQTEFKNQVISALSYPINKGILVLRLLDF